MDCPLPGNRLAGTSKTNPWGWVSSVFLLFWKSGPTSGPLTVSSQVTHEPQGMMPPEQLPTVPLRLVNARITSPFLVTWIVVVPPPPFASYGVPGPNAGPTGSTSWLRTRITVLPGPSKVPMPSWRPGSAVPSVRVTGDSVSWNER